MKKNFENIKKLAQTAKASAEEMNQVVGGNLWGGMFLCTCSWGAYPPFRSQWTAWYFDSWDMYSDINRVCVNGAGGCRRIG